MPSVTTLLVANRGEIALRVLDAAAGLGIRTVAVHGADEAGAWHVRRADEARALPGSGPAAYLDVDALLAAAAGCDAVHPGYGFRAEDAGFARRCLAAGLTWVGPAPELLALFGDKAAARALAVERGVPVLRGTAGLADVDAARALLAETGAVMVKAVGGGGGRGMRAVRDPAELPAALRRCRSEAGGEVYAEELREGARHVEVQLAGDGAAVVAVGDRDCSVQRRHQKLVETAPAPDLAADVRAALHDAAVRVGAGLRGVATVEFLVDRRGWVFLEVNPRIQVEHTVTEEVTGVDLVEAQLRLAAGATLAELGLAATPPARAVAVQARLCAETLDADGAVRAGAGTLDRFAPPSGRGVRVDTAAHPGAAVDPRYDSLLAKVVVTGRDLPTAAARAARALDAFEVGGVATNRDLLAAVLRHPGFPAATTAFLDEHRAELLAAAPEPQPEPEPEPEPERKHGGFAGVECKQSHHAGIGGDPLPPGAVVLRAPMAGALVEVADEGTVLAPGAPAAVLEAMKMEHPVAAETGGRVLRAGAARGAVVAEGDVLAVLEPGAAEAAAAAVEVDPDHVRPDLAEVRDRRRRTRDAARPDAVARRRRTRQRTARENVEDLCDPGTFTEYGAFAVAAQRRRRSLDELIERTPADGLVGGTGEIGGRRCVVAAYDYTVLAGTQGFANHRKTDRLIELAHRHRLPFVIFAEGGGGRPGDTDQMNIAGLDLTTFAGFARLSGTVPVVAIVSGYCFAGNAALAGCADVIIATEGSSLGMGGPAMIAGGGLGEVAAADVGPMDVQTRNGVVDVLVADEAAAVAAARRYLSLVAGERRPVLAHPPECADQRLLRHLVPENRVRAYDVRAVLHGLADSDGVLELRPAFGVGIVTALARIGGRPVGVLANDPRHLGGAIDAPAADKAARFLQLCDAHGLPVVSLCDTPGFMVGPDAERTATVRHVSRMFVAGANARVPIVLVVLRKGYGLGAMAMAGGGFTVPVAAVAWPTGEFGGMGLEGAVRLGYRAELAAIDDPAARERRYRELVDRLYEQGKALSAATAQEIDDVIDPADTRAVVEAALRAAGRPEPGGRAFVDTW